MKDIHHTCRCTGQQFTFKEWCAWIKSHEKARQDSSEFVVLSHNGFDFNIHDVCLTPNRPVRLFNTHCVVEVKTAQSPTGRWDYGLDVNLHNSGHYVGVGFVDDVQKGYPTEAAAILAALLDARKSAERELANCSGRSRSNLDNEDDEYHQANRRSAPCNGVQTTNPILIMTRHVESHMQRMCVGWFRLQYPAVGKLLFAVPNGGARSRTEAAIMKAEGVTAGVTDLILLLGRGGFNALCIEMKTTDRRSALSDAQIEWRSLTITNGNRHVVCRTLEEFQSEIRWYMARPANNEPRDEITCARPIVPPSIEEIERAFGKIRRHKINHQSIKTAKQ